MSDWLGLEQIEAIERRLEADKGPEDRMWYRGADGAPYFHNAPGGHAASVEYEMGLRIRDLVVEAKPDVIVDVGTNLGHSATWLLLGVERNRKGHVWTYDIEDWRRPEMNYGVEFFWRRYGIPDRATFVLKPVWETEHLPASIDFVFEDASHDVEPTIRQLEALTPRMSARGVMAFHDVFLCRHEGEVLLKWFGDRKSEWSYEEWQQGRGLGIARRR